MRLTPEDSARLLPPAACFLRRAVALHAKIFLIRSTEWAEMFPPGTFAVAEFTYPQITARDLSIRLQPLCLQSACRRDFKVRGFL
ncbi:hypothetical protein CJ745_20245 [Salmonella enterica subsp. enterica]|nr:hypothetical protein [Salmonella enterica subsp. enterica]EBT4151319.1 hypothetical protein [Salmonella enterica subsp. enterica]EED9464844.1 hypothetical protein [Salmonella enterica subsp. enterica serovar Abaetetuba]